MLLQFFAGGNTQLSTEKGGKGRGRGREGAVSHPQGFSQPGGYYRGEDSNPLFWERWREGRDQKAAAW